MKKKLFAICLLLMALLLTGCSGSDASIDGVWRSKNTEYEFSDGLGRRIDYVDGKIQGAEGFTYTVNENTVTLLFEDGAEPEYTWSVSGKRLKLSHEGGKIKLTAGARESVPYLPDGYIGPLSVTMSFDGKHIKLTDLKTAQLLELLRRGEVTEQGTAQPEELEDYMSYYIVEAEDAVFNLVNELLWVADGDKMITYKLSNAFEIKEFIKVLGWDKAYPESLESGGFAPTAVYSVNRVTEGKEQGVFLTREDSVRLAAMASQGDAIGLFDGVYRGTYYEVHFLTETDESPTAWIYPDGTMRMDGVLYDLLEAEEIFEMLDALGDELYITQQYVVLKECTDEPGELIYVNLNGVPNGGSAKWRSSNASVCTVDGNNARAKIRMKSVGEAVVTAESRVNGEIKSVSLKVSVVEDNGYNLQISPEDQKAAERLARRDYEAWRSEDWCLNMNVVESVVDKKETLRYQENYVGFREGWTAEYMTENAIVVRVTYDCQIDHSKIWYDDGRDMRYTYLTRADVDSPWEITDYGPAG